MKVRADQLTPSNIGRTVTIQKAGGRIVTGKLTALSVNTVSMRRICDTEDSWELASIDVGVGETTVNLWPSHEVELTDEP